MSTGEWVVAVVLILTLGAVLWYAWEARKQAKASVKMAEEMREQRLDADRPYLLIEVPELGAAEWEQLNGGSAAEPDGFAAFPKRMLYRVYNAGRGPAKEIFTTLLHSLVRFDESKRDVLRPGDSWSVEVEASKARTRLHEAITGEEPQGIEDWMKSQGVDSPFYGDHFNCGLMVGCSDIHDRRWATYLKFSLILRTAGADNVVVGRTMVPVEHRIVQLEGEP